MVAAEVTRRTIARACQELRLVTSAATVTGDFSDRLFQSLSATKDALHQGRPQCLTIETHTGLVTSLEIFLGRQNVADPFVCQPANGERGGIRELARF